MSSLYYLLDTHIVSNIARHPHDRAAQRLITVGFECVGINIGRSVRNSLFSRVPGFTVENWLKANADP